MNFDIKLVPSPVNYNRANELLTEMAKSLGGTTSSLIKIFNIGLLTAHYEMTIMPGSVLGELTKDNFIRFLSSSTFTRTGLGDDIRGKNIAVYNAVLDANFLVSVRYEGGNYVYYCTDDQTLREDMNIHLVHISQNGESLMNVSTLSSKNDLDSLMLGTLLRLENDYTNPKPRVKVPTRHPSASLETVFA